MTVLNNITKQLNYKLYDEFERRMINTSSEVNTTQQRLDHLNATYSDLEFNKTFTDGSDTMKTQMEVFNKIIRFVNEAGIVLTE